MKDQKGIWMPVKIWPHSVGNIRNDVPPSGKVLFRWPKGETRDAYAVMGTVDNLPGDNKHLLWLEIEQAAHPFGKARTCESCHRSESQLAVSTWEFQDDQGAEPFQGTHRIVADRDSLRIEDIRNTTPLHLLEGAKMEDFASWVYLKDRWKVAGDFSIKTDREKYKKSLGLSREIEKELKLLDARAKGFDKKTLRNYKALKGAVLHNPEGDGNLLTNWRLVSHQQTDYNRAGR
jgi:hypothetical protein